MLARVRSSRSFRFAQLILLAIAALTVTSCATKEQPQLVSDGTHGQESALPWNRQEKWENTGKLGALADQLQSR